MLEQSENALFSKLNGLFKKKKKPEKRLMRHPQEREIIDIAMANLSQCESGQMTIDFVREYDVKITIMRGHSAEGAGTDDKNAYVRIPDTVEVNDPQITILLAGALRETMQEYEPSLRKPGIDQGEAVFTHRMTQKLEDKLFWETVIVYELGKIANKNEFIDSFTLMGYYNLIDGYEKDLTESS